MEGLDEDVQLMMRVQAGDSRSFEVLFAKHSKGLMNFMRRFVDSQAIAQEWTQDVFLKVYRARESYEPSARFRTYLFRVATNHCLNELRRGVHKARHESLDEPGRDDGEGQGPARELRSGAPGQDALLEGERLGVAVEAAIALLPEKQRAALLLLRYEGQTYEEIGAALGLNPPAVKSLLNRAKVSLRARLGAYLGEPT